ncbi:hypothetical protein CSB37_04030 [bacterium DOLZORAL124_38_8]|nr:MAG: hypothetical protein CSB37_04030 [bacterium DOLZORAL124_38_8]
MTEIIQTIWETISGIFFLLFFGPSILLNQTRCKLFPYDGCPYDDGIDLLVSVSILYGIPLIIGLYKLTKFLYRKLTKKK